MDLISVSPAAWKGLEPLRGDLTRYLARRCRDRHDIEDVVQESFVRAARYRNSLQSDLRLRAWLLRIAHNVLSDRLRHERRRRERTGDDSEWTKLEERSAPESEPSQEQELWVEGQPLQKARALVALAEGLPELCSTDRDVLLCYYSEGESCRHTAERLGLRAEVIKVRLYRARQRLRRATLLRLYDAEVGPREPRHLENLSP